MLFSPEMVAAIVGGASALSTLLGTWISARVVPKHVAKSSEIEAQAKVIDSLAKRVDQQDARADKMQAELDRTHDEARSAQQAADEAHAQTKLHHVWNQSLVKHIESGAPPPPPDPPTGLIIIQPTQGPRS
ncbi:hypothetical protein [Rothia sp. P4278]|uniref:hypothetical protein n=1 Tax=Rothia sp. P4278 TaxID=3402658 RepID=UPI003AEEF451